MSLKTRIKNNSTFYSNYYSELLNKVSQDNNGLISKGLLDIAKLTHLEESREVNPLPLVISQHRKADFEELIRVLPNIYKKAVSSFFKTADEFMDYLGESSQVFDYLNHELFEPRDFFARHDVIYCKGKLQLLEVNAGSNIGGWDHDLVHSRITSPLRKLLETNQDEVKYQSILANTLIGLARSVQRLKPQKDQITILIKNSEKSSLDNPQALLQQVFQYQTPFKNGKVYVCQNFDELEFTTHGQINYQGKEVDVVLLPDVDTPDEIMDKLLKAHLAKQLVLPDSPLFRFFGNKLLLALLHEELVLESMTVEERLWIQTHIPWSAKLDRQAVFWDSKRVELGQLLRSNKERFVIKRTGSMKGEHVFIGKYLSQESWETALLDITDPHLWIAQLYCDPDTIFAVNMQAEIKEYTPVWGVFDFNNQYGGSMVRALPVGNSDGVINSHNGAVEFLVTESLNSELGEIDLIEKDLNKPDLNVSANSICSHEVFYSEHYKDLMEYLAQDDDLQKRSLNLQGDSVVDFMRNYEYQVSLWPMIINQQLVTEFDGFIRKLPALIYKAIKTYFKQDSDKFASYLNLPAVLLDLLNQEKFDINELIIRHDLVFSDNQFKLLEVNSGSSIGGWQHDWLQAQAGEALSHFKEQAADAYQYRNVTEAMLRAVSRAIVRKKTPNTSGNILIFSYREGIFTDSYQVLEAKLERAYQRVRASSFSQGRTVFFTNFEKIEFLKDGRVSYEGQIIDAVLLPMSPELDIPRSVFLRLVSSSLANHIVFPDSPLHTLAGNKHVLSLLHEFSVQFHFTTEEKQLINRHVPWSNKLDKPQVQWKGELVSLTTLLTENKDRFVIKKSQSMQGRDVIIGKFTDQQEWSEIVVDKMSENDWMAQEYFPPDRVAAIDPGIGISSHEMVWGIFDLGNCYSGAFVRGVRVDKNNGVINSANGATEFMVFEEQKTRKTLVI